VTGLVRNFLTVFHLEKPLSLGKITTKNQSFLNEHVDFRREAIQKRSTAPERYFHRN